ncbi:MAG: hypothetical protein AAF944_10450 [Bacteroidota bacterium]
MEPFDIDNIIREKLQQSNDLHKHQLDSAKPFIWGAVQQKIIAKRAIMWYHLAAAVVLLMIIFSFVLYGVQQQYRQQADLLAAKLDQMQQSYESQSKALYTKDTQAELLATRLGAMEQTLASLQAEQPPAPKKVIIYRTDTVYIKQVEYVAIAADSTHSEKLIADRSEEPLEKEATLPHETKTDDVIFLSSSNQGKNQPSESIKFKFGAFSRED